MQSPATRILMLAPQPFFQDRGTPIATRRLLEILTSEGYRIDLLTFPEGEDIHLEGCRIQRVSSIPGVRNIPTGFSWKKVLYDAGMCWRVMTSCCSRRWDLVHASEEAVFIALLVKLVFRIPYLYDMDSSLSEQLLDKYGWLRPLRPLMRWLERQAVVHSEGVIAVCQALEQSVGELSPTTPIVRFEDAALVPEHDVPVPNVSDAVLENIPRPRIMYVGNLEAYQGIDLLLDAFVHVFHSRPRAHLVVIGGRAGAVATYGHRASLYGVADRVHFLGPRPVQKLGAYLRQADILVSPRLSGQNTPMKIYSYMGSGTPIVATRLETHLQVLDDTTALLVPPTPLDLAQAIRELLDHPELGRELGEAALDRAQTRFSSQILDGKLAAFYESVCENLRFRRATRNSAVRREPNWTTHQDLASH